MTNIHVMYIFMKRRFKFFNPHCHVGTRLFLGQFSDKNGIVIYYHNHFRRCPPTHLLGHKYYTLFYGLSFFSSFSCKIKNQNILSGVFLLSDLKLNMLSLTIRTVSNDLQF